MLAISLLLSCIFSGALICSFIWAIVCQVPQVFSISGLRLYFPELEPWVSWSVTEPTSCWLAGQLQPCPPCSTVCHLAGSTSHCLAHPDPPGTACISASSTGLDECVFFNSLVDGLPYSLIFCQFWLFFWFLNCCCSSFGCARRHSVSTYAFILAKSPDWPFLRRDCFWDLHRRVY